MASLPAILLLAAITVDPRAAAVEADGVRIETSIRSQKYTWTVTNVDAPPIMRFEIDHFHAYGMTAPDGWQVETTGLHFDVWTDDVDRGIPRGESFAFRATVSSHGGELCATDAVIGLEGGERRTLPGVWTSMAPRRSVRLTVIATLFAIILGHAALVARRDRRRGASRA